MCDEVFWDDIVSIDQTANEDVYDLTVDDVHNFFANDLLVHNCSELVLCAYDSCRLLVTNLVSFILNAFTDSAKFDFEKFHEIVGKAQRLMDDLVDLEIEAVDKIVQKIDEDPQPERIKRIEKELWEKIRQKCVQGRRTGTGITGLGDALAMLGIRYGSEESIQMTEEIYKANAIACHTMSCKLAEERGAFPIFDWELEKDHVYLNKVMSACNPEVREMWKKTGRRNIALTTTAPGGSISTLSQTTSGIEPAYLLSYKRRRKLLPGDSTVPDFVDASGDKWQEYIVYHHQFKKWMEVSGKIDIEESPYWKATANDVDWLASVSLQAAAQKWVDHAISKTCVSGDTLVETNNGLLYTDEIAEKNECRENKSALVTNLTTKNHLGRDAMIGFVLNQGIKQVYRLTTKSGQSIKTTIDHKFILLDDEVGLETWVELKDINIGDRIKLS